MWILIRIGTIIFGSKVLRSQNRLSDFFVFFLRVNHSEQSPYGSQHENHSKQHQWWSYKVTSAGNVKCVWNRFIWHANIPFAWMHRSIMSIQFIVFICWLSVAWPVTGHVTIANHIFLSARLHPDFAGGHFALQKMRMQTQCGWILSDLNQYFSNAPSNCRCTFLAFNQQ